MGHFAELFVLNGLTPIAFRAIRKRLPSGYETGEPAPVAYF